MSYRALFVADVHLSNSLPFAVRDPETLVTDRLLDTLDVLKQMGAYADQHGITDIWILGDLLDKRLLDAVTLKMATEAIIELEVGHRVIIIPGNHEAHDAACRHYALDYLTSHHINVAGGQGEVYEVVPGFRVLAVPYLPANRVAAALDSFDDTDIQLAVIHQTIRGGRIGNWVAPEGLDPDLLARFPFTLAGHFHIGQDVTPTVSYLGAPVQHSFSDVGDPRGYWDITFPDKGKPKRVKVPVQGSPLFHEVEWITTRPPPSFADISAKAYVNLRIKGSKASVDKLWKSAQLHADSLQDEVGVRMVKLTAVTDVTPAKQRLILRDNSERPSWDQIMSKYLDVCDTSGLNRARLEALGKELISDVET